MKIKLSEWASIAEIIGAFAVVVSLIYVGVQVNDSASAVRAASANDANTSLQNWYLEIGSDQQTSELFYEALTSEEALSNAEEFQFLMMLHGAFLAFQNSYLLAEEGTIDAELREAITAAILGVQSLPGMDRYWRQRRSYLHSGFAKYVDDLLLQKDTEVSVDIYRLPETEADGLSGPEAVRYDPELDLYFVSNFNGEVSGDANAFVSKLSPDGELLVLKFMVGTDERPFHGGRGMFIVEGGLWVVDAGGVHLFDRKSGEQLDFVDFSQFELGFLNDIVLGKDGAMYVTDTGTASLYRIVDREVSLVTKVPMNPNGITADPETGRLLLAPWSGSDEIIAWDIDEERFSVIGKLEGGGNFDGIEIVGDRIIIASQMDTSLHFMVDGVDSVAVELPGKPADIGIDTKRNRVAVPYVALNQVEIIQLEEHASR